MNNKQIDKLIREGKPGRWAIDHGLYFRISSSGSPSWQVRYTLHDKRKWFTLAGSYPRVGLADAKLQALNLKAELKQGVDPAAERKRAQQEVLRTVDDLFYDWFETDVRQRLKHPQIAKRIYNNEIKPQIGSLALESVTPRDIRSIIHSVLNSGRKAVANDTLMYAKQLFRHAVKLNLVQYSPAQAFTMSDAGGQEKSRKRALSIEELETVFRLLREQSKQFTRDNYLACALLVSLGVRKGELIAAKWEEFDLPNRLWHLPEERSKTKTSVTIPLPESVIAWLKELEVRACGAEHLFPSRRSSRRRDYISDDTLNHALAKLFGQKVDGKKQPTENILGNAGIEHFTVHDLRRTCRSLLASIGTPPHVAERCLNHKLRGIEGVYDRHDYLIERREALERLACLLEPVVNPGTNVLPFRRTASRGEDI